MRRFVAQVFEAQVAGVASYYTKSIFDDALGAFDVLAVQAVVDRVTGISPRITVNLQVSGDGIHYGTKTEQPLISSEDIFPGTTNLLFGADTTSSELPSLAYARLEIHLEGTSPRARVRIWICCRGGAPVSIEDPDNMLAEAASLRGSVMDFPGVLDDMRDDAHVGRRLPSRSAVDAIVGRVDDQAASTGG